MLVPTHRRLTRQKMLSLLDELKDAEGPATSLYVPSDLPLPEVEKTLKSPLGPGVAEIMPDIAEAVGRSKTGGVIFWGEEDKYLMLPPFSVKERLFSSGYDVEPLRALLQQELIVALILLRLGA